MPNRTEIIKQLGSFETHLGITSNGHRVIGRETIYPDPWWKAHNWAFVIETYLDPEKLTKPYKRSYLKLGENELPAAAAILAVNPEGAALMVNAYRQAVGDIIVELPSGAIEPGEDITTGSLRELAEETGYKVDGESLGILGEPGLPYFLSNERIAHAIVSLKNAAVGEVQPDEHEHISSKATAISGSELLQMMVSTESGLSDHTSLAVIGKALAAAILQFKEEGILTQEQVDQVLLHALKSANGK